MSTDAQYTVDLIDCHLIGWTIIGASVGDAGLPSILLQNGTRRAWMDIQKDAEGNGPGWIEIAPTEASARMDAAQNGARDE